VLVFRDSQFASFQAAAIAIAAAFSLGAAPPDLRGFI
jgi:hypothetical protein